MHLNLKKNIALLLTTKSLFCSSYMKRTYMWQFFPSEKNLVFTLSAVKGTLLVKEGNNIDKINKNVQIN
jgi:hypothetical protein